MEFNIKKGYLTYKNKEDPLFVVPHSGPALIEPTSRDDNSETVASICWQKLGGILIISNLPRGQFWGIDFNRDIPPQKIALENYSLFEEKKDVDKIFNYQQKYAWVAKDERDYEDRLKIYQNFWGEMDTGRRIILIHRSFPKLKNAPSIIDIVTFKGKGVKKQLINKIVSNLNEKYDDFFTKIGDSYREAIFLETKRTILHLLRTYNVFSLGEIKGLDRYLLEKDLAQIQKYAQPKIALELQRDFNLKNFLKAAENALTAIPRPKITIENSFTGDFSFGPKRKLFPTADKVVVSIESTRFMNFWYPKETAEIINDIVEQL